MPRMGASPEERQGRCQVKTAPARPPEPVYAPNPSIIGQSAARLAGAGRSVRVPRREEANRPRPAALPARPDRGNPPRCVRPDRLVGIAFKLQLDGPGLELLHLLIEVLEGALPDLPPARELHVVLRVQLQIRSGADQVESHLGPRSEPVVVGRAPRVEPLGLGNLQIVQGTGKPAVLILVVLYQAGDDGHVRGDLDSLGLGE
jgi:hypothetical protein